MNLAQELRKSAVEDFVTTLAQYLAEQAKDRIDINTVVMTQLRDKLTKLSTEYSIQLTEDYVPGTSIEREAQNRSTPLINSYNTEKLEKLKKEYAEAYNKKRNGEVKNDSTAVTAAETDLTRIEGILRTKFGKDDSFIDALNDECEKKFSVAYVPTVSSKLLEENKALDAEVNSARDERVHKIKKYEKGVGLKRLGMNALAAAASTALIMVATGITLTVPYLPMIGGIAFASMVGAEGYRRTLTRVYNGRTIKLDNIYENRLNKSKLKLQKIQKKAEAKFDKKTGKYSSFYEKKITKQNKKIKKIKHKIVKVNKNRTHLKSDILATAIQILGTIFLSLNSGPALSAYVGIGVLSFIVSKLVRKFSSKTM